MHKDTNVIHYFAREWQKKGNEIFVFHLRYIGKRDWLSRMKKGQFIKRMVSKGETEFLDGVKIRQINILKLTNSDLSEKRKIKIAKIIERELDANTDIMIVHFPVYLNGIPEKISKKCKMVCTLHGTDFRYLQKMKNRKDRNNSLSPYCGMGVRSQSLMRKVNEICDFSGPQYTVLSGLPAECYIDVDELQEKYSNFYNSINIVYAGKINRQKKVYEILQALALVKSKFIYKLEIIGDGDELQRCKEYAIDNKLNVVFSGEKSREYVFDQYRSAHIFVMVSDNETLGLSYLEAMANGCITIGSIGEGIDGIIRSGINGFLLQPGKPDELYRQLLEISKMNTNELIRIANNAYATVSGMTDEHMADQYLNNVRSCMN
jgi:glycosyltransferase involved in cell wall biosynthesis